MTMDIIFLVVVVIYGLLGAKKGCVHSLGGLIALVLSWVLAKLFSLRVTIWLFHYFNVEHFVTDFMNVFRGTLLDSSAMIGDSAASVGINGINIVGPANKLTDSITGVLNASTLNVGAMFVSILLFTVFMFIFFTILRKTQDKLEDVPMGKTLNGVLGFACGVVKGVIVMMIIYFIFMIVNTISGSQLPVDSGIGGRILQILSGFKIMH